MSLLTHNELDLFARELSQKMQQGTIKKIGLSGPLGAGKTELVKSLAHALGAKDKISSPTFTVVHQYKVSRGILYHIDLYRVDKQDKETVDMVKDIIQSGKWVVVEWADRVQGIRKLLDCEYRLDYAKRSNERELTTIR